MSEDVVSYIKLSEHVDNADRKFGSNLEYQPCYIEFEDEVIKPALFTKHEILKACERAAKNPEDMGSRDESLLEELKVFFNF